MKHRARWKGLLSLVAAGSILTGATASGVPGKMAEPAVAERARTTVTLSGWGGNPTETRGLERTIAAFERANRDIDVRYAPISGDYDAAMLARFAARRPPDVFYVDSLDVPDYMPALEPLNSYIAKSKFPTRRFFPRLMSAFTRGGKIYGFPKDWSPLGLIGNPTMLRAAGVTPPRTWVQFQTALERLRARNAVPGGAPACMSIDWARVLPFVFQNRGGWLNASRTRSLINSPANHATVNFYLGLIQSGLARTPAQLGVGWCGEALGKEKAAFIFEGNWVPDYMRENFPNVRFQVYPMLRNKARGNLGFTVSYSIGKFSKNKPAAWRLVRFLVGTRGMRIWVQNVGYLPSRRDVKPKAGRGVFLREAPHSRAWQFVPRFDRVVDLANKELEAAFEGKQSIDVALRKIHEATQAALR